MKNDLIIKNKIYDYFLSFTNISNSLFDEFYCLTSIKEVKKGDYFLTPLDDQNLMGIVLKGSFKSYYITHEGNEHIKSFMGELDICSSYKSEVIDFKPNVYIQAFEDSVLLTFDYSKVIHFTESVPEFMLLRHKLIELEFTKNEIKDYNFITRTIDENYKIITEYIKKKKIKAKKKDLANYLCVTNIAFSRIQKRNS